MHVYWIRFKKQAGDTYSLVSSLACGVTAYDYQDALRIVRECVFDNAPLPEIEAIIEDVDLATLDEGHVVPNMSLPLRRGVWFPRGYEMVA